MMNIMIEKKGKIREGNEEVDIGKKKGEIVFI